VSKLFDRFRRKKKPGSKKKYMRPIDKPLIGSELFEEGPKTARDIVMPMRKEMQKKYISEGRDPGSLSKSPNQQRDEQFWMTYIDSLTVFEKDEEAYIYVEDCISRYPNNPSFKEIKFWLEYRMGIRDVKKKDLLNY
jgi:hypothetical protein